MQLKSKKRQNPSYSAQNSYQRNTPLSAIEETLREDCESLSDHDTRGEHGFKVTFPIDVHSSKKRRKYFPRLQDVTTRTAEYLGWLGKNAFTSLSRLLSNTPTPAATPEERIFFPEEFLPNVNPLEQYFFLARGMNPWSLNTLDIHRQIIMIGSQYYPPSENIEYYINNFIPPRHREEVKKQFKKWYYAKHRETLDQADIRWMREHPQEYEAWSRRSRKTLERE